MNFAKGLFTGKVWFKVMKLCIKLCLY